MRAGRNKKSNNRRGKSDKGAIARLPQEDQDELDSIAAQYGIQKPRPGSFLDDQYTTGREKRDTKEPATLYTMLVGVFGTEALNAAEGALSYLLGGMLVAFLSTGIAIAAEAFYKASGKVVPPSVDAVAVGAEKLFTPLLVAFLVLSSIFGVYKQSQLNSGMTQFDEKKPGPRS